MNDNDTKKQHILFSVAGMTPAVITETLFGLWKGNPNTGRKPITKGRIHILTTKEGAAEINGLATQYGKVAEFNQKYGTDWDIQEKWDTTRRCGIEVLRGKNGQEILDLRTREDNEIAADRIVEIVRDWTSHDEVVLHASLAGGRRTMGVFLAQALSWFARREDNLYHVLVPRQKEADPKWFFPEPSNTHEQDLVDFSEQPFVRMRDFFLSPLADGVIDRLSYRQMMKLSETCIRDTTGDPPIIKIIIGEEERIEIDDLAFMPIAESASEAVGMYLFLCKYHNLSRESAKGFFFLAHNKEDIERLKAIFRDDLGFVSRKDTGKHLMDDYSYQKRQKGFRALLEIPNLQSKNNTDDSDTLTGLEWATNLASFSNELDQRKRNFNEVFSKKIDAAINDKLWPNASFRIFGSEIRGPEGGERHVNIPLNRIRVIRAQRGKDGMMDYRDITKQVLGSIPQ